jgi:kumamolisin
MVSNINLTSHSGGLNRLRKFCAKNTVCNEAFDNCLFNINPIIKEDSNSDFDTCHCICPMTLEDTNSINKKQIYGPELIKKAYNIPEIRNNINVRKVKIAIISAFHNPYLRKDVETFGRKFKLPKIDLSIYNLAGKRFNSTWALETVLDVSWAYAINPYAKIFLIEARTNNTIDILNAIKFANKLSPDVISMSLGSPDKINNPALTDYFSNTNTCYLAASGNTKNPAWPSVTPNVMSIGATKLYINNENKISSEIPWVNSGAGFSVNFGKPYYQPNLDINSKNKRVVPDVVINGDPKTGYPVIAKGKQLTMGGTSSSTPVVAGILSLIIQNRLNNNKSTLTTVQNKSNSIQPLLYDVNIYNECFNDIDSGYTGNNKATLGFDNATGLGSINCQNLINSLAN